MYVVLASFAILIFLALTRTVTDAATQTQAYYALQRRWCTYWPFHRGKGIPRIIIPFLKRFVPVWVEVDPAVCMLLDPNDLISRVILETGAWDEATWSAIERRLGSGATFVDIGAHEGYCSLKASRIVGPTGCVIAVEPNPQMVRLLDENIRVSGTNVIAVKSVACSDSDSTLELFSAASANTGSTSFSRSNASLYGPADQVHKVRTRRLDAIIREADISRVDVVKIDVEGAELLVLKGGIETFSRYRPVLLVELEDRLLNSMGTSSAEVIAFLDSCGYRIGSRYDEANYEFLPCSMPMPSQLGSTNTTTGLTC